MTLIEIFATIFGFICVYLTIKENIWCWPTGLVQVILYLFIFWNAKLYSDFLLHIFYVGMQFYGWYFWLHGGKNKGASVVSKLTLLLFGLWIIAGFGATGVWGYIMATNTDAAFPYGDAFTTVFSLIAQWLLARKKLESWYFWIAVDVIAIYIYYHKGLYFTTGLYSLFLIMAITGLLRWKKSTLAEESPILESEPAV